MIRRRLETAAALTVLLLASHGVGLRARAAEAPVAAAAMREDLAEVRALMSRGADVNAAQGDGMTALHWAAERGNAELTALLLTVGRPGHGDDPARQLHAAPSRRPSRPRRRRAGADHGRGRRVGHRVDRRDPAAPGRRRRQPRDHRGAARPRRRGRRPRARMGPDAADVRRLGRPHRRGQGAARGRRRPARRRQGDRHQRAQSHRRRREPGPQPAGRGPATSSAPPRWPRSAATPRRRRSRAAPAPPTMATSPNRLATPTWSARMAA